MHRDLPLEAHRGLERGLRQVDLNAVAGRLDIAAHVDEPGQRRGPQPGERAATGVEREMILTVVPARAHHPAVLVVKIPLLGMWVCVLVPRMAPIDRIAQRIVPDEHLLVGPVVVVGGSEQDPDAQVDVHQIVGDELAVDDHAGRDEHRPTPLRHVLVVEVADCRILEGAPAAEQRTPQSDLLVTGQRLVEEVEEVVMHRHDLLHELDVAHQTGQVVGHQLDRCHRSDAARVERRGVDVPTLHQAEHLPGVAAHVEGFPVEVAGKRIQRSHDVADGAIAMITSVRRLGVVRLLQHAGLVSETIFSQ